MRAVISCALLLLPVACGDNTGPDDDAPAIRALEPLPGAAAAPVAGSVIVRYSSDVAAEVAAGALVLERDGAPVAGTVVRSSNRVLEFRPADILELGTSYRARVTGVRAAAGAPLPDTAWTFTTAGWSPPSVDGVRLFAAAEALAHDSTRGRLRGSADELRAAHFIRSRMQAAGLVPAYPGEWLQRFTASGVTSQNVLGVLPGAGALADEWVIIGAHYDHLGVGPAGVYNGADDNASGTAGMLELARVLAAHAASGGFGAQPRRAVLFAAFGAEEGGLIGSNWFCAHPTAPLTRVAGMLNLDMIGRLREQTLSAHGVSSAAEWPMLLERYGGGLTIAVGGLVGTDYRCFLQQKRPALALFTGLHEDYHQVTDDAPLLLVDGMVRVGNLALGLATNLMLRPHPPAPAAGPGT